MNRKTKTKLLLVSLAVSSAATLNVYAGGGDEDQATGDCAQAAAAATTSAPRTLFDIACGDSVNLDEFKNTLRGFGNYANRLSKLNEQDDKGNTVLHIAVLCGHLELAKFILRNYDVNLSLRNSDGKTVSNFAYEAMITAIAAGAAAGKNSGVPDPLQKEGAPKFDRIPYLSEPAFRAVRIKEMIINFSRIRELVRNDNYRYIDMAVLKPYITQDTADIIIDGHTLLELAIDHNDTEMVEFLLTNHASANALIMHEGEALTPFRLAIQKGNTDLVKCLLEHGADVNDDQLFYALNSQSASSEIVKLLVEHRANANLQVMREDGILTPLKLAIKKGDTNSVKYLLEHGADANLGNPLSYALHLCHDESHKDLNMVRLLLDHGADLNSVENDEFEKAIKKICSYGSTAELNRQSDESGNTIFHLVVKCGHFELTKFLLENYDFDQQLKNNEGLTVLDVAHSAANNAVKPDEAFRIENMVCNFAKIRNLLRMNEGVGRDILQYITEDTVGMTLDRRSLFEFFVEKGNFEAVEAFINHGFNVSMPDQSIVSLAIYKGHYDIAKYLVKCGANVEAPIYIYEDEHSRFKKAMGPLWLAIKLHNLDLVDYLIKHGANVNVSHSLCYALLCYHESSSDTDLKILELLLKSGAKFGDYKSSNGTDPKLLDILSNDVDSLSKYDDESGDEDDESGDEKFMPLNELLENALEHKNFDIIKFLADYGIDSSCVKYYSPIVHKIIEKHLDLSLLESLLKSNAELCNEIFRYRTPLNYAISHGNTDAVKLLIKYGANPNQIDEYGRAPLVLAVFYGDLNIVEFLLQEKANPNIQEGEESRFLVLDDGKDEKHLYFKTPLNYAVSSGNIDAVKLLLKYGANLNQIDECGGAPLTLAVCYGDPDIVKFLLQNGADSNIQGGYCNYTPLNIAIRSIKGAKKHCPLRRDKYIAIVQMLLDNGAKISIEDKDGITPAELAVASKDPNLVNLFLKHHGASAAFELETDKSLLQFAIRRRCNFSIIKTLIISGANPAMREPKQGFTALHEAVKSGDYNLVRYMIDNGGDIDSQGNRFKATPLHIAVDCAYNIILKSVQKTFRISSDKDVEEYVNSLKYTAADRGLSVIENSLKQTGDIEAYEEYLKIAQLLIQRGANTILQDLYHRTPIDCAACSNNPKFFMELLNSSPGVVDNLKWSQAVWTGDYKEVERLITEKHANECLPGIDNQTPLYLVLRITNNMIQDSLKEKIPAANLHFFNNPGNVRIPPMNNATTHDLVMKSLNETGRITQYRNYIRVAELLIRSGANVNERHEGSSLLRIAQANHNLSFIKLLLNKGAK